MSQGKPHQGRGAAGRIKSQPLGSDIRPLKDAALLEMGLWVRDGATPWQTLVAATRHGAAVCGVGADPGTVDVGKLADLFVVAANPLEDIINVWRLQLVLKEGAESCRTSAT